MEDLVDFSELSFDKAGYGGSDEKYNDIWHGTWYMFKFGQQLEPNDKNPLQASYENSPVSEYLGSKIFASVGIDAQETILGTYRGRSVVACKDFVRNDGHVSLMEFNQLQNSTPGGSSTDKRTPEYDFTMKVLTTHPWLKPIRKDAIKRFWQTLCMDALLGNFDRHAGNWGYLADTTTFSAMRCAPVYDCGSCLHPRLAESAMLEMLHDRNDMIERMKTYPNARLLINGKRPHYQDLLTSKWGREARRVLVDLWDRIDLEKIHSVIEACPGIDSVRREFFHMLVDTRKAVMLDPAYELGIEEKAKEIQPIRDTFLEMEQEGCLSEMEAEVAELGELESEEKSHDSR